VQDLNAAVFYLQNHLTITLGISENSVVDCSVLWPVA